MAFFEPKYIVFYIKFGSYSGHGKEWECADKSKPPTHSLRSLKSSSSLASRQRIFADIESLSAEPFISVFHKKQKNHLITFIRDIPLCICCYPCKGVLMKRIYTIFTFCLIGCFAVHAEPQKGLIPEFPLDTKLFPRTKDYFSDSVVRKVYRAFKNRATPESWGGDVYELTPEECVEYENGTSIVYVPDNYDDSKPFGIYLHITPSKGGVRPNPGYRELMAKYQLIFISPNGTPNRSSMWRRIVLGVDSMATVKAHYKIDPKRVYVGGTSGGGHMGMFCQMLYPEHFNGAISHAAQSYLPSDNSCGHFPGLGLSDTKKGPRRKLKWAVISGDKDFNYKEILKTSEEWIDKNFDYKFFDIKGMGHSMAKASDFEQVLIWMGATPSVNPASTLATKESYKQRTWIAANGSTSSQATLVKILNGKVMLKKPDGKTIVIPITKLSKADRDYLKNVQGK